MNYKSLNPLLLIILCFFTCFIKAAYANEASLSAEDAWISEAPTVTRVMVAQMTLKKNAAEAH